VTIGLSMTKRQVFFLSDRTGITAETLGHALLTQFEGVAFENINCPYLDSAEKVAAVVARIDAAAGLGGGRPLVFSTLVDPQQREMIGRSGGVLFDLFDAFIGPLESELGVRSSYAVGRSHGMGVYDRYKTRIDAVNFALAADDGVTTRNYSAADVILLGVSRSGKTPTCLYLALHYGIRAANYPLTEEDLGVRHLPAALEAYRGKLFGLTIDPERLQQIRSERRPNSRYATLAQCQLEVQRVEELYRKECIPFLDTSAVSIEEIATTIMHRAELTRGRRR